MISAFRMGPVASGRGLCDVDRVLFGVTKSENWEALARRKITDNLAFSILIIIGIFSPCQDFSIL